MGVTKKEKSKKQIKIKKQAKEDIVITTWIATGLQVKASLLHHHYYYINLTTQ